MSRADVLKVDRAQVIAYRVAQQGLHRGLDRLGELAVLDIGVQEAMGQPAGYAFAARLDTPPGPGSSLIGPGHELALVWSLRGAPHVHRRNELDSLARALFPLGERDAQARLGGNAATVERQGMSASEQFAAAVRAVRLAVSQPMAKGAASTAISAALPGAMLRDCRACRTRHVSDPTMRVAAFAAGLELEPGTSPPVLWPREGARVVTGSEPAAVAGLARSYLRLLGPATVTEFAGYVGGRRADIARTWPEDLVEVQVGTRTTYLPASEVDALGSAPAPDLVRLLGPFDPYLQARDRMLIVADRALHKRLWPVLGRPGAVFVDGEVAGTWRVRTAGSKITITVEVFGALRRTDWDGISDEAERVAVVRGAGSVEIARVR